MLKLRDFILILLLSAVVVSGNTRFALGERRKNEKHSVKRIPGTRYLLSITIRAHYSSLPQTTGIDYIVGSCIEQQGRPH